MDDLIGAWAPVIEDYPSVNDFTWKYKIIRDTETYVRLAVTEMKNRYPNVVWMVIVEDVIIVRATRKRG